MRDVGGAPGNKGQQQREDGDSAGRENNYFCAIRPVGEHSGGKGERQERQDIDGAHQTERSCRVRPLIDLPGHGDGRHLAAEIGAEGANQVSAVAGMPQGVVGVVIRHEGREMAARRSVDQRVSVKLGCR